MRRPDGSPSTRHRRHATAVLVVALGRFRTLFLRQADNIYRAVELLRVAVAGLVRVTGVVAIVATGLPRYAPRPAGATDPTRIGEGDGLAIHHRLLARDVNDRVALVVGPRVVLDHVEPARDP